MSKPSALTRQLKAHSAQQENVDEEVVIEIKDYQESKSAKVGLKDFELLSVLGKGAYGKVYLVKKSNVLYAMKVLKKASIVLHTHSHEQTRNERNILQELEFEFIVKLHYAFQTDTKLYLLLTYAPGGELFGYLAKEKMFPEDSACFYTAEILVTLDHLHELGIIYRDLKPENVLLAADGHICLTDFGLSKVALTASTVCGTPEFTAPEIFEEKSYDKAVDYWSLGVMLYDMLTGSPPFIGHNRKKIMESILRKKPVFPNYLTPQARDICGKLLKKNPKQRLGTTGVEVAKKHSFFRKIDWKLLLERKVEPPFVPDLLHPEDTSHFHSTFTDMPLESPPMKSNVDRSQLDEFLGFSYAVSPNLSSVDIHAAALSPQNEFLGFSYVALNDHSLKSSSHEEISDHTRYTSDGEIRSRLPSDGEVQFRRLSEELQGHLSSEDECMHSIVDELTQSYSAKLKI